MPRLKILIIEDEAIIGMLLTEVLVGMGHSVIGVVGTESAAITSAAEYLPDLLIVDDGLAIGNGVSAVDKIVANRFVPHIFTTGNVLEVRRLKPDAIILDKPFHEVELAKAIDQALDRAALLTK